MLLLTAYIAISLGLIGLQFGLWVLCLRVGLTWAKVPEVTTKRIAITTACSFALLIALNIVLRLVSTSEAAALLAACAGLAAVVLVPALVVRRIFGVSPGKSLQASLPLVIPPIAMALLISFLVLPFVLEAFSITANSLAPTLVGKHWRSSCPECGELNYCSPPLHDHYMLPMQETQEEPQEMICKNFHVRTVSEVDPRTYIGDRIMVAKFLKPQRWDLVVFKNPATPSVTYVKRLVGLPGETIVLDGGAVHADGVRLALPESLHGIEYLSELPPWEMSGTKDRPAVLGDDEYFVLGDFSLQSNDSRTWTTGAPGHPAFAVPADHLQGVVTHIYWPLERWRSFR